jgi:hypothetical protein
LEDLKADYIKLKHKKELEDKQAGIEINHYTTSDDDHEKHMIK